MELTPTGYAISKSHLARYRYDLYLLESTTCTDIAQRRREIEVVRGQVNRYEEEVRYYEQVYGWRADGSPWK